MLTVYDKPATGSGLHGREGAQHIGPASVWIDLINPTVEEDAAVEAALGISIPTRAEMREIESSSRLYIENGATYMTAFVISDVVAHQLPNTSTVTFIVAKHRLVTVRYSEPKAFSLFLARINKGMAACRTGEEVMIGLVEALISDTADLIELVQDQVERLTAQLFQVKGGQATRDRRLDVVLRATGKEGDKVASAQEGSLSIERMLNFFRDTLRRDGGDELILARSAAALTDIASLNDHMGFLTDRTSFLLQATLGMINIEQNQVIKLFSVMAVMLMPPTLVASIYGMNFKHMPELDWPWGYPAALAFMFVSAVVPFIYFRRKGWL